MFEFIRNHQRLMQFLLLVLIVPPFAFWGIDGYKNFAEDPNAVAKVAGHAISQQEFTQSQREQMERQREVSRNLNIPFDAAQFDTPAARDAVLENLVNQRALLTHALKNGVVVTDDHLREVITAIPALQEAGKFDRERYLRLLAAQNMTPAIFEDRLRQDLAMQTLNGGVAESSISPRSVQAMIARAQGESREIQEFVVKGDALAAAFTPTPDAVKAYYDANQREFAVPAQVKVEYLVMSIDAVAATLSAPAADIRAYYDQNAARYRQEEERSASHILIKADPKADRSAAKAKAEEVLKEAKAPKADFAALAKKYSQDPGSAAQGGSLGSFARGAMVKPFEEAVFAMKEGEISNLVESDFGFHIIKLASIKPAKVRGFDEVKAEIEKEWVKREAQKKFSETAESFTNTVYEQADSLKPAADKFKLKIVTTDLFARAAAPKELANPKLLDRLFSEDAIKARRNTEALETAPGTLVSARVVDYKAPGVKPMAEVEAQIKTVLKRKEGETLAAKEGEAKLKAAQAAPDSVAFGAVKTVSRTKADGMTAEGLRAVMAAPADKLPAIVGTAVSGGYAVYRINKVTPGADNTQAAAIQATLMRVQGEAEFAGFLAGVRAASKAVVYRDKLEKKPN